MTYQLILKEEVPVECSLCGEDATRKHTYLLEGNARRNPASAAYGRDDCSWCSDHEEFTCDACCAKNNGRYPKVDGYESCSTFENKPHFKHMFVKHVEKVVPLDVNIKLDGHSWHAHFSDFVNLQESPNGFGYTKVEAVAALFRESTHTAPMGHEHD